MPASDNHLRALGRITAAFQLLEMRLGLWVSELIGKDQTVGFIITSQLSFKRLCAVLAALFRHKVKAEDAREKMTLLLRRAVRIEEKRNAFVHSTWSDPVQESKSIRCKIFLSKKATSSVQLEPLVHGEMDAVAESIGQLIRDVQTFSEEVKTKRLVKVRRQPKKFSGPSFILGP
jgi:hypothetical protein